MQISDLPFTGVIPNGLALRREVMKAINHVQIVSMNTPGGKSQTAGELQVFFETCAGYLEDIADLMSPTISQAIILEANPSRLILAWDEVADTSVTPAASSFTIGGQPRTITSVAWLNPGQLALNVSAPFTDEDDVTVTYVAGDDGMRDPAGNKSNGFSNYVVTNQLA